mmetsp:Transcript_23591/g.74096  ORF Transcript_23591/g.74096 Transcript_23591/m.74096 type:complete len:304 (-) Transcript_23591:189-1100(-)
MPHERCKSAFFPFPSLPYTPSLAGASLSACGEGGRQGGERERRGSKLTCEGYFSKITAHPPPFGLEHRQPRPVVLEATVLLLGSRLVVHELQVVEAYSQRLHRVVLKASPEDRLLPGRRRLVHELVHGIGALSPVLDGLEQIVLELLREAVHEAAQGPIGAQAQGLARASAQGRIGEVPGQRRVRRGLHAAERVLEQARRAILEVVRRRQDLREAVIEARAVLRLQRRHVVKHGLHRGLGGAADELLASLVGVGYAAELLEGLIQLRLGGVEMPVQLLAKVEHGNHQAADLLREGAREAVRQV